MSHEYMMGNGTEAHDDEDVLEKDLGILYVSIVILCYVVLITAIKLSTNHEEVRMFGKVLFLCNRLIYVLVPIMSQ